MSAGLESNDAICIVTATFTVGGHGKPVSLQMQLKQRKNIFALLTFAVLSLGVANFLRGCASEHSRPSGHGDIDFDVSPSGQRIVFNALGNGGRDLYALDLKTKIVTQLTDTPDYEGAPAFSPDGQSLVYAAGTPGDRADHLFISASDGSLPRQLTNEDYNDEAPAFSRDGSRVVFTRNLTYNWGGLAASWGSDEVTCEVNLDGSGLRRLTAKQLKAMAPGFSADKAISPDGTMTAFARGRYAPDYQIFIGSTQSKAVRQLTRMKMGCFKPRFAPDGKSVFFQAESWPDGPSGVPKHSLWRIGIDGKNRSQIASYRLFDDPLKWKP